MGKIQVVRVVIDTNVLVSALLFGGVPARLVSLWKSGRIQPLASQGMIDEVLRVLAYPKFSLAQKKSSSFSTKKSSLGLKSSTWLPGVLSLRTTHQTTCFSGAP